METQYYLLYKDDDGYVLDKDLYKDENYIGLYTKLYRFIISGKHGQYFSYPVTVTETSYAYVGCKVETVKSRIVQIPLEDPIQYDTPKLGQGTDCTHSIHLLIP